MQLSPERRKWKYFSNLEMVKSAAGDGWSEKFKLNLSFPSSVSVNLTLFDHLYHTSNTRKLKKKTIFRCKCSWKIFLLFKQSCHEQWSWLRPYLLVNQEIIWDGYTPLNTLISTTTHHRSLLSSPPILSFPLRWLDQNHRTQNNYSRFSNPKRILHIVLLSKFVHVKNTYQRG